MYDIYLLCAVIKYLPDLFELELKYKVEEFMYECSFATLSYLLQKSMLEATKEAKGHYVLTDLDARETQPAVEWKATPARRVDTAGL